MLPNISSYNPSEDGDLDILADYISYEKDQYGQGMENLAIAYLNREKSIQGYCSFFDPYYTAGDVHRLNTQLVGQRSRNLVSAPINVYGNDNAPNKALDDLFENTLKAIDCCHKNFDKIFIPIGCQEENMPGHNIALVLEKSSRGFKATILDQMGSAAYAETKAKMIMAMTNIGIRDIETNVYPLTDYNRNDCASVVSYLRDHTLDGHDMRAIKNHADQYYNHNGCAIITTDEIDAQHERDQVTLLDSADALATNLIKRDCQSIVALRGINDLQTPRDLVTDLVHQKMRQRNNTDCISYVSNKQGKSF